MLARDRIEAHHRRQLPADDRYTDALGVELGTRWTAIEAVGIYVPGGTASYPSSVLMNAVPAKVAGVERVVMVTPTPEGKTNPLVLAAARSPASTRSIGSAARRRSRRSPTAPRRSRRSSRSSAPATPIVAAAKRQVFGQVGIDMIAGPSEVLVVADRDNDPGLDRRRPARPGRARRRRAGDPHHRRRGARRDAVEAAVERQLATLPRGETARASWRDFGAIILVDEPRRRAAARRPHRAGASGARGRRSRGAARRKSAMPARSSSAAIRRK